MMNSVLLPFVDLAIENASKCSELMDLLKAKEEYWTPYNARVVRIKEKLFDAAMKEEKWELAWKIGLPEQYIIIPLYIHVAGRYLINNYLPTSKEQTLWTPLRC